MAVHLLAMPWNTCTMSTASFVLLVVRKLVTDSNSYIMIHRSPFLHDMLNTLMVHVSHSAGVVTRQTLVMGDKSNKWTNKGTSPVNGLTKEQVQLMG